jgi:hypothetical protein
MTNNKNIDTLLSIIFLIIMIGIIPVDLKGEDYKVYFLNKCPQVEINGTVANKNIRGELLIDKNFNVSGYYEYYEFRKKINLTGTVIEDSLILMELDDNLMPRAKFNGLIDFDCINGVWADLNSNNKYPFQIRSNLEMEKSNCSSSLVLDINHQLFNVISDFHYNPFDSRLTFSKDTLGFHYCLIEITSYSKGNCFSGGTCGCGLESTVLYLKLDSDLKTISRQEILYHSCNKSIILTSQMYTPIDTKSNPVEFTIFDARNKNEMKYYFDKSKPDQGIIKIEN